MLPRHSHASLTSSGNSDRAYNSSIHWEATAGCNGTFMQRQQEESASREHESRPGMSNRLWRFGASLSRLALRLSPQPPWNRRLSPVGPRHVRRTQTRSKNRHENACFAGCTKSAASLDLWNLTAAVDMGASRLTAKSLPIPGTWAPWPANMQHFFMAYIIPKNRPVRAPDKSHHAFGSCLADIYRYSPLTSAPSCT